jgi:hypothetical protein
MKSVKGCAPIVLLIDRFEQVAEIELARRQQQAGVIGHVARPIVVRLHCDDVDACAHRGGHGIAFRDLQLQQRPILAARRPPGENLALPTRFGAKIEYRPPPSMSSRLAERLSSDAPAQLHLIQRVIVWR